MGISRNVGSKVEGAEPIVTAEGWKVGAIGC